MACGIPVICFRDTSISELINHETDGYIVDNINSNDLKTGIEWMEKRVDENHFLNETVRKKVSNFSAKSIAKQYMNLYSSLLK